MSEAGIGDLTSNRVHHGNPVRGGEWIEILDIKTPYQTA